MKASLPSTPNLRLLQLLVVLLICMPVSASASSHDYTPGEIPNPNAADRRLYVADPGNLLSSRAKAEINSTLWNLRNETTAEVAVAIVPSIGDTPIEDFSEELFTRWGLGKKDKDNGILVVIALGQRRARIATGYGAEGVLPDITAKKIINRSLVPHMKEGDIDQGAVALVKDLADIITSPEAAAELKSGLPEKWNGNTSQITSRDFVSFILGTAGILTLIAMLLFLSTLRKTKGKDRYIRATAWHHNMKTFWILTIVSLGMALPFAILALWMRHRSRNKPMKCNVCGAKMNKLNEEEDNQLLSPAQDLEERLGSVDYDVWECPTCGSVERFPFREDQARYSECPQCGTVAMCLVRDHTLRPATVRTEGIGEQVYECMYCHHRNNRCYSIPKKPDPAAALAAGAIIGSMGRGGNSGGFGGGFGGGSTGGGGASGGW